MAAESLWDAFNVGLGISQFSSDVAEGNYWWAALGGAGTVYDIAATCVPFLPGGASFAIKSSRVSKYEVGAFDELTKRSAVGDKLDIHHAAQKHPASQAIVGYNPNTAPSIAVPAREHRRIPTIKGEYSGSARDLLAKDIKDLRNYTNAPNSALQNLIRLNKETYPGAFNK